MRRIILRMIAAGSLSAFSTAAAPLPEARGPAGTALQPVRTPAVPVQPQPMAVHPQTSFKPDAPPPSRSLPRGSLLDLSV